MAGKCRGVVGLHCKPAVVLTIFFMMASSNSSGMSEQNPHKEMPTQIISPIIEEEKECCICLLSMKENLIDNPVIKTPCKHEYHKRCLQSFFDERKKAGYPCTCPLCRVELDDQPAEQKCCLLDWLLRCFLCNH